MKSGYCLQHIYEQIGAYVVETFDFIIQDNDKKVSNIFVPRILQREHTVLMAILFSCSLFRVEYRFKYRANKN
jgi:hypothetical protein